MTIDRIFKYFILIFIIIFFVLLLDRLIFMMLGNEFSEPEFNVQGHRPVLNEMVINIESVNTTGSLYTCSKVQTLLFKGNRYVFENHDVWFYKIYFSYGNKVGVLTFENLYRASGGWERINNIYVIKKDNDLYLEYYPVVSDDRSGRKVSDLAENVEDYFAANNISKDEQSLYLKKFFEFYEPDQQKYKRDPLDKDFVKKIEQEPLDQKMFYDLDVSDIKTMDIPLSEKEALIRHAEKAQVLQPCNN